MGNGFWKLMLVNGDFLEFDHDLGNFLESKGFKEMALCMTWQELRKELLHGLHNEDLRTLLEYKKLLWAVRLKQDMAFLGVYESEHTVQIEPLGPTNIPHMEPVEPINEPPPPYLEDNNLALTLATVDKNEPHRLIRCLLLIREPMRTPEISL